MYVNIIYQKLEISPKFPFNKRGKLIDDNGVWYDTAPLIIRNLK